MNPTRFAILTPALLAAFVMSPLASADTIELVTDRDNTLIEDPSGSLSLGAAFSCFAGRVGPNGGGTIRRALLHFDVASEIPPGSTVTNVTLRLRMSQSNSGSTPNALHRVLADWGEGASEGLGGFGAPSEPGDATWMHTFYSDQFWSTPGGEFEPQASSVTSVGGTGYYTWNSTQRLIEDVQGWVDDSAQNFGWILIGNESSMMTVKKYETRESGLAEWRPRLTITFDPPANNSADLNGDGTVDGADLGILLSAWGTKGPGDLNGDGAVDGADLGILLAEWD